MVNFQLCILMKDIEVLRVAGSVGIRDFIFHYHSIAGSWGIFHISKFLSSVRFGIFPFLILVIWIYTSVVLDSQCSECFFEVSNWLFVALLYTVEILTMLSWSDYFLLIYLFEALIASNVSCQFLSPSLRNSWL